MIKQTKVDTYQEEYLCDDCGYPVTVKELILLCYPEKYQHFCTNKECQKEYFFTELYPRIIYKKYEEAK